MLSFWSYACVLALASQVVAHYTFPDLLINGVQTADWVNVRMTDNHYSNGPVTDVTSEAFRCYTAETHATAQTIQVAAGSQLGFVTDTADGIGHPGSVNIYMAKAPGNVTTWDGSGQVWFKVVHEIGAVTDGGQTITWPAQNQKSVSFTVPKNLPNGQYLVRIEAIALHVASTFGGAQFYIACGQVEITGGGSGNPGPKVSIPGVYTGYEPGILINIYYPVPTSYTQPGPAVWTG
ncbi:hypothetical protein VKT23_000119 [Stygiomarasmius scandens]|uniref:lytic cellulose monooxygenase (C4-dehydrogenating) n=1 Tax=Marasmiellus scandens TaxID=2682957 RepID=A0ABR1K4G6_9AGAR